MQELHIRDEFIKMGQALKLAGYVDSGLDAKEIIQQGEVLYNGEVCTQRGKKCYEGDVITFEGQELVIRAGEEA